MHSNFQRFERSCKVLVECHSIGVVSRYRQAVESSKRLSVRLNVVMLLLGEPVYNFNTLLC